MEEDASGASGSEAEPLTVGVAVSSYSGEVLNFLRLVARPESSFVRTDMILGLPNLLPQNCQTDYRDFTTVSLQCV